MARDTVNEFTEVTIGQFAGGKDLTKTNKNKQGAGLGGILAYERARLRGVIPSARTHFNVLPTANDTVTIGGHVFKFVASLAAATTFTQVKILGSAALTLAVLIDAINGVTNANAVAATTAFSASIEADIVSTDYLRVRGASAQGGESGGTSGARAVPSAFGSTTLAISITAGSSAWNVANLNASGGKALGEQNMSVGKLTITAAMITAGSFHVELPFTPTLYHWEARDSSGIVLATSDTLEIDGDAVKVNMAGTGAPALVATDEVTFVAYE